MRTTQKVSMKEQIIRKGLFVFFSFAGGIVTTVLAAATYDASVQSRASTIFNSIQSVAGTLDESDVPSYYNLVRMNIASLIQVLTLVDTKVAIELGTTPGLDDLLGDLIGTGGLSGTGTTGTGTTGTGTTGTGTTGTGVIITNSGSTQCAKTLMYKNIEICDTGKTDTWSNINFTGSPKPAGYVGDTICPTGFQPMYWETLSKIQKVGVFDFNTASLTLPSYHLNGIISYKSEYCSNSTPSTCSTPNSPHAHSFSLVNGKYTLVPDYTTTQWGGTGIKGALCIKNPDIKICEIRKSRENVVTLNNANSYSGKYITEKKYILADDSITLDSIASDVTGNYTYTLTLSCSDNGSVSQSESFKKINSCASGYTNIDNKCMPNSATLTLREYGCETKQTYYARQNLPLNQLPGYTSPSISSTSAPTLSGAVRLTVCDNDSMLNNAGSTEYAFEDIKRACPTMFHPMERWELDLLGGTPISQLSETTRINNINKNQVTHWLGDNMLDNESSYGYIQYSSDLESPSSDKLRVRCVQNNEVGRDGKTDLQLAGCSTIKRDTTSGIEYCASASKLKEDYSKGLQVSGGSRAYSPYMSAEVTFSGSVVCPNGFDYPSEVILFSKISGLALGAKTYEYGTYKISFTRLSGNRYAIRDESPNGDKTWKVFTGKSIYDYLRGDSYVQNNDLIKLSDMIAKDIDFYNQSVSPIIGGVCIKKTTALDTYLFKLTGCSTVKKIGTVDICEGESEVGKCSTGYHVINYAEYSENKNTFFQPKQVCSAVCSYINPPVTPFKSTYTWGNSTQVYPAPPPPSPDSEGYKVVNLPQTERFAKRYVHNGSVTGDDTGYIFSPNGTKIVCIKD